MFLALLFLVAQASQVETPAEFSCGPFLLQPSPHSMTVVIDHEMPLAASMRYWSGEGVREIVHADPLRHHVFALADLSPDTLYSYEITAEGHSSQTRQFRTLPLQPKSYRVLVVGDVRSQPKVWGQVSERMFEHESAALFAIGTGDYPVDGRQYQRWVNEFFVPARSLLGRMPLWPAIGNHELTRQSDGVGEIDSSHYFSLFELPGSERWYRVDYELITLLVLDSNTRMTPGLAQYEWLRAQLRSARNRYTLVALHHQPLTSGPHGALGEDGTPLEWPLDEGRRFLVPLFEMYAVDLVLGGHDHFYERSSKDGITYLVTGGGGAPLYKVDSVPNPYQELALSTHHYVALDIDAQGIAVSAIDRDGALIDSTLIASTPAHVARRTQAVTAALKRSLQFGPLDVATRTSAVELFNPLDRDLDVRIGPLQADNGHPILEAKLKPQERRTLVYELGELAFDSQAEPWRAPVVLEFAIHFKGRDQALDVELGWSERVAFYQPQYSAEALVLGDPDGDLAEWNSVPKMHVDDRTPLIKNVTAYKGPTDLGADIQLGWNAGWLHLAVTVRDDEVLDDPVHGADLNDFVRLFFRVPGVAKGSLSVFTFSALGRLESKTGGDVVRHQARQVDGGWVLEASLPLGLLGVAGSGQDARLEWDLLLADRDGAGKDATVSYHRLWSTETSLDSIDSFGVLRLVD